MAPGEPIAGFVGKRAPDCRARGFYLALCQAEKREAGLRTPAHFVAPPEGPPGRREIAQPQADLAELVKGLAGRVRVVRTQLFAGAGRFARGVGQRAPETQDPGPGHAAHARDSEDALTVAPLLRGVGPLAGAPVVGEPTAGIDGAAEDVACGVRAEGPPHRGHWGV